MGDYFKFGLLPTDIKTQVFSFVRFADWIQILARVCSEWRNLCKTSTLPKIFDVREIVPSKLSSYIPAVLFDRILQLAQQYNVTGLFIDVPFSFRSIKKITKALPKLSWLQFLPPVRYAGQRTRDEVTPLTNSITHLEAGMIANAMKFEDLAPCLPNLQVLNFNTNVTLDALQKMTHKFEKVKTIRTGIKLVHKEEKKKRQIKKRRTAGENVGQLIEFVEAFKKVAPSLTTLYMFWEYKPQSKPAELKREFEAVEEAASSKGIKLYCRDLVRILKSRLVHDPKAEFFLACYKHNNLPYRSYTYNNFTLLQHAIASSNVPAIKALFKNNYTTMDYELSVGNECNRVAPDPPCMTDSAEPFPFPIARLIPYSSTPQCLEIVQILRENGYDVSKMLAIPKEEIIRTPVWSKLNLSIASVKDLFNGYTESIKWFDKNERGETFLHKVVTTRGTPVYLDLLEEQLKKTEITELLAVTDNRGNTPVHLFGEASVETINRLIPYAKGCWELKNKKDRTPLGQYIDRCQRTEISIKEPKLRLFIQEASKIEDNDIVELCRTVNEEQFRAVLPLLIQKKANILAENDEGLGLFFLDHSMPYFEELERHGIDFKVRDQKGNNFMHAIFMEKTDADRKELIEFLVKNGVDINQVNENGDSPLVTAIQTDAHKLEEIIETLLKSGADPNIYGPTALSPLIIVLGKKENFMFPKKRKVAIVKLMLQHGAKPDSSIRIDGKYMNPLAIATATGSLKLVRLLVDHGANIMERDDMGNSMLHIVSHLPNEERYRVKFERMVDYLLQHIDVNDRNLFEDTVLHKLYNNKHAFYYMVSKGADINASNTLGDTALFLADDFCAFDVEDELVLSPKLDLLAVNKNSHTVLHILVKNYQHRLKPFMERFNAMPIEQQQAIKKVFSINDGYNTTALHEAVGLHELESVKICVEVFGLSPNMKNKMLVLKSLDVPLVIFKERKKVEAILNYLLEHGADINAQDEDGKTLLHDAVEGHNSRDWIKFLLEKGADPKIKNYWGKSVSDLMPNLDKLPSGTASFTTKVKSKSEDEAEEDIESENSDDDDDEHYSDEEDDDVGYVQARFNSDEMDEGDAMEVFDHFMPGGIMGHDEEEEEDEEMGEIDDEGNNDHNNNNNSDDDEDDDDGNDRPRKGGFRTGPTGPYSFQFNF